MASLSDKAASKSLLKPIVEFSSRWTAAVALVLLLLAVPSGAAETLSGRVVGVSDGDTITVLYEWTQYKVRVAGIDAPEKKQAYGDRSRQYLSYLVFDKWVTVEYSKRDRYGRIVGKVWVAPGDACPSAAPDCPRTVDTGLELLIVGLAWHYKQFMKEQPEQDRGRYSLAEEEAQARRAGLWNGDAPIPPWEWRRTRSK